MRMLLVEAAQNAVRYDPQMRMSICIAATGKPKGVAKVPAARKLAIRLYWMLARIVEYPEVVRSRAARGWPGRPHGG